MTWAPTIHSMTSNYPHAVRRTRMALGAAGVAVLAAVATLPGAIAESSAPAGTAGPVSFILPPPTGPDQVGTLDLHLVVADGSDIEAPGGAARELMVSIWYPAHHSDHAAYTPYLPRRVAAFYDQTSAELGIAPGLVDFAGALSHAQTRAPVDVSGGPRPVVLYSPGGGLSRALGTTLVEELVSHGYVVVTVDSTGQAPVEFPDGMVLPAADQEVAEALTDRVGDLRSTLDSLETVAAGGNPDVEGRTLPEGIGASLALDRVGAVGHSIGGFAVA